MFVAILLFTFLDECSAWRLLCIDLSIGKTTRNTCHQLLSWSTCLHEKFCASKLSEYTLLLVCTRMVFNKVLIN